MEKDDDINGKPEFVKPEHTDKFETTPSADENGGSFDDIPYAQIVNLQPRMEDAFKIAIEEYKASLIDEKLRKKNEQLIAYLATDGRVKLDQAVLDIKKVEAETTRHILELEDETAIIDIPLGAKLTNEAIFKKLYNANRNTLIHFGFLDENGASKEGVTPLPDSTTVLKSFTTSELEMAQTFQGQSLILVPSVSFVSKIEAMNSKKDNGPNPLKAIATSGLPPEKPTTEQVLGWRAYIVEFNNDNQTENDDYPGASCATRAQNRMSLLQQNGQYAHKGLNRHLHIMLAMDYQRRHRSPGMIGKKVLLWGEHDSNQSKITVAFCISGNLIYRTLPSHLVCTDACLGPRLVGGNIVM